MQQDALDYHYLRLWASELGLVQLLEQALVEAGVVAIANQQGYQ